MKVYTNIPKTISQSVFDLKKQLGNKLISYNIYNGQVIELVIDDSVILDNATLVNLGLDKITPTQKDK